MQFYYIVAKSGAYIVFMIWILRFSLAFNLCNFFMNTRKSIFIPFGSPFSFHFMDMKLIAIDIE